MDKIKVVSNDPLVKQLVRNMNGLQARVEELETANKRLSVVVNTLQVEYLRSLKAQVDTLSNLVATAGVAK